MKDSLQLVALLSMGAVLLALISVVAYYTNRGQAPKCPKCGLPQQPGWSVCPYHQVIAQEAFVPVGVGPITQTAPPQPITFTPDGGGSPPVLTPMLKETMVGNQTQSFDRSMASRGTVILEKEREPKPLAFLAIIAGQYFGEVLRLNETTTKIGRNGDGVDHTIDDDAISGLHLSIRHQDGVFTATDMDTGNGTLVNDERIIKQSLKSHDVIKIGRVRMVFFQMPVENSRDDE
jgi:hypothetical protein